MGSAQRTPFFPKNFLCDDELPLTTFWAGAFAASCASIGRSVTALSESSVFFSSGLELAEKKLAQFTNKIKFGINFR